MKSIAKIYKYKFIESKSKAGLKVTTGKTRDTFSFTWFPSKIKQVDELCKILKRNRTSLIVEGLEMILEKYNAAA